MLFREPNGEARNGLNSSSPLLNFWLLLIFFKASQNQERKGKNRNRFTEYITKNYIIYGISICCLYIADRVGLEKLTTEEKRWVEKEIVKGKRNGLHLR